MKYKVIKEIFDGPEVGMNLTIHDHPGLIAGATIQLLLDGGYIVEEDGKWKPKMEFRECDTCRAKPGSPILCSGCLHNRAVIEDALKARDAIREALKNLEV